MGLRVEERVVKHRAVVDSGLPLRSLLGATKAFRIRGHVLAVASPHQVALHIAMLGPPAVPTEQSVKTVLQQPAIVKLPVQSQYCDRAHGRFRTVETAPVARAP